MRTAERDARHADAAPARTASSRVRAAAVAAAGPALIAASVVVALRGFAFADLLSNQHPDILSFWLPRSCLMGRSLAAGHVPLWNPFEMAGTPFAADPQSGWLYVTWMATSLLGCGTGLRAFIVLQPVLAGLGLWWFLRREGLGRAAATAGGLSIAMAIAASNVAISLPFAGTLAWTPFALVGASGFSTTRSWRRLGWLALSAFAWGQVAAAHLSHGLVMCTALVAAYMLARNAREVAAGRTTIWRAVGVTIAFFAFLPAANLALLIPHFALIQRSSLRGGYAALGGTLARAAGIEDRPLPTAGEWSGWPLSLGSAPGAYVGGAILLSIPAALRARGRRYLVAAFLAVGVVGYLLTLNAFVGSPWFRDLVLRLPFGDVYLHNPGRLRYLALLVAPVLGAVGIQSFLDRSPSRREIALWLGGAAILFVGIPLAFGAYPVRFVFVAVAMAVTVPAFVALRRERPSAATVLVAILAADLLGSAIYSSTYQGGTVYVGLEGHDPAAAQTDEGGLPPQPLRWPDVNVARYLAPGPIARTLQARGEDDGRYLAWVPPAAYFNKGYLFTRQPNDWPALLLGRAILFGLDDALGYSPIQLPRYWSYVRATDRLPVFYNASVIQLPSMQDVWLLGVRYLVEPTGIPPTVRIGGRVRETVPGTPVTYESGYQLVEVRGWQPRASVVSDWRVVRGVDALHEVLDPTFDPSKVAVVEEVPKIAPSTAAASIGGSATYREMTPEDVRVSVDAAAPSVVVVRNAWDGDWKATVDGRPTPVLRADYFLPGVAVPAGRHLIRLTYRDPTIGRGLAGSASAWGALAALALIAMVARRRRGPARRPAPQLAGDEG